MKGFRYTLAERAEIEELIRRGLNLNKISRQLERNCAGLRAEISKNGGFENYNAIVAHKNAQDEHIKKAIFLARSFSDDEIAVINEGRLIGYSINKISQQLGCQYITLKKWLLRNNLLQENSSSISLEERLINIEQQIEIILQFIEGK